MTSSRFLILFCTSILLQVVAVTIAQAQDTALYSVCSSDQGNFTANSTYQANLNHLLSSLTSNNKLDTGFFNVSYGQNLDKVNAMGLCRGDVKPDSCRSCIATSTLELPKRCPNQKEAIIWYDNCMLRYSNRFFFGKMEFGPWFWMYNLKNVSDASTFNQAVKSLLDSLKNKAASGDKFATGNANTPAGAGSRTIYALVQCTPDLSEQQCIDCLNNATKLLPKCCDGRQGGRVIAPSCNFRYEINRFYDVKADAPTTSPSPSPASSPPPPTPTPTPTATPTPTPTADQPPASQDKSPTPPPTISQPPESQDKPTSPPSPPPTNSASQKGKASPPTSATFVLVLVPLLLWQYL